MLKKVKVEMKKQYTVFLKPSVVKEIDHVALAIGLSRSALISSLIMMSLEAMKKDGELVLSFK